MGKPNHSFEFRIAVVKYYLSGRDGIKRTAAHFGIHPSSVGRWVVSWKAHGIDGLAWKSGAYSPEFKLNVVKAVQKSLSPFARRPFCLIFPITKVVKRWCDAYEAADKAGLQKRKQPNVNSEKRPVRVKRVPGMASSAPADLTYDQLLAEVRYLRAEADYLKNLSALAQ